MYLPSAEAEFGMMLQQEDVPRAAAVSVPEPVSTPSTDIAGLANSIKRKAAARSKLLRPDASSKELLLAVPAVSADAESATIRKRSAKQMGVALGSPGFSKKSRH